MLTIISFFWDTNGRIRIVCSAPGVGYALTTKLLRDEDVSEAIVRLQREFERRVNAGEMGRSFYGA